MKQGLRNLFAGVAGGVVVLRYLYCLALAMAEVMYSPTIQSIALQFSLRR